MISHYVRDGSGNVLAIYENKILDELVIYGSSRLGSYNGKTTQGKRTLGNKKYELSNHLGNVLAVISPCCPSQEVKRLSLGFAE